MNVYRVYRYTDYLFLQMFNYLKRQYCDVCVCVQFSRGGHGRLHNSCEVLGSFCELEHQITYLTHDATIAGSTSSKLPAVESTTSGLSLLLLCFGPQILQPS